MPNALPMPNASIHTDNMKIKIEEALEQTLSISKLKPSPYNPNIPVTPGSRTYNDIKRSIETFGNVGGLVWNKQTGNVVGGHQRLIVLKDLGVEEVRVRVVNLPLEKEKALNIALNRIKSDPDENKLAEVLVELSKSDFDLAVTGYNDKEVRGMIDDGGGAGGRSVKDVVSFEVIISCKNEQEQVYEQIKKMGYDARVLTL